MVPGLMEVPPQVMRCSGIPCLHLHSLVTMRRHPGIEDKISGTPTDLMVNTMPHSTLERLRGAGHGMSYLSRKLLCHHPLCVSNISELGCFDYLVYQLHHSSKADIWTIDLSFPSLWLSFLPSLKKPIRLRLCSYSRRRTVNFGFLEGIVFFFHEVVTLPA